MKKRRFRGAFVLLLLLAFVLLDVLAALAGPLGRYDVFPKNDYEKIIRQNGGIVFERVFFGNSAVIASYLEEESGAGFRNIGMDYGKAEDLLLMLRRGFIEVRKEVVIGLNIFTLMDTLDTNPTYPWHRRPWTPYLYFERDRLRAYVTESFKSALRGEGYAPSYTDLAREVYPGALPEEELRAKQAHYAETFWTQGAESFSRNLKAMGELAAWCAEEGITLRAVWMPWNPWAGKPEIMRTIFDEANGILRQAGVETLDLTDAVAPGYFHDIGHLNYESGAPYFTGLIDPWLRGEEIG